MTRLADKLVELMWGPIAWDVPLDRPHGRQIGVWRTWSKAANRWVVR